MPPKGKVRPARLADVPTVADLHRQHLRYHVRLDQRYLPRLEEDWESTYRAHLRDLTSLVLVIEVDGVLAGFALCHLHGAPPPTGWLARLVATSPKAFPPTGTIVDLFVADDYRRQGYGTRLVAAALDWFRDQGAVEISLGVLVANEPGRAFWEGQGFEPYRLHMRRAP